MLILTQYVTYNGVIPVGTVAGTQREAAVSGGAATAGAAAWGRLRSGQLAAGAPRVWRARRGGLFTLPSRSAAVAGAFQEFLVLC